MGGFSLGIMYHPSNVLFTSDPWSMTTKPNRSMAEGRA
jgi:hypothetical protein